MARIVPEGLIAEMSRTTWTPAQIFRTIQRLGKVEQSEMEKTFNMGVGMVAVVSAADADTAQAILTARHVPCWVLGTVENSRADEPRAVLDGDHPRF